MLFENQYNKTTTPSIIKLNSPFLPVSNSIPKTLNMNNGNYNKLNSSWIENIKKANYYRKDSYNNFENEIYTKDETINKECQKSNVILNANNSVTLEEYSKTNKCNCYIPTSILSNLNHSYSPFKNSKMYICDSLNIKNSYSPIHYKINDIYYHKIMNINTNNIQTTIPKYNNNKMDIINNNSSLLNIYDINIHDRTNNTLLNNYMNPINNNYFSCKINDSNLIEEKNNTFKINNQEPTKIKTNNILSTNINNQNTIIKNFDNNNNNVSNYNKQTSQITFLNKNISEKVNQNNKTDSTNISTIKEVSSLNNNNNYDCEKKNSTILPKKDTFILKQDHYKYFVKKKAILKYINNISIY
ncbi:hypothetical protein BCR36DRAFT_374086 [Piromyces finnis]|uniref:Uncharacterized protein n=1 Tax=Piromyces finnis TaxID=1754191 RepID=A0A1Y1UZF5_9FUNG|nr:hypothetical protein BCR36DRAFT_374086 [Piromyces finnis]|eukprot:ORX43138.1 hypothetical protein BCR36DRAFT_374086 [Piromyces finnis]